LAKAKEKSDGKLGIGRELSRNAEPGPVNPMFILYGIILGIGIYAFLHR
jgi:hypothetical protein